MGRIVSPLEHNIPGEVTISRGIRPERLPLELQAKVDRTVRICMYIKENGIGAEVIKDVVDGVAVTEIIE